MSRFTSTEFPLGGWPPRGSVKRDPPYGCFCARPPRREAFGFAGLQGCVDFFALSGIAALFAAGRASHKGSVCTVVFCRRPALGAKLFGHRAGAIRRGPPSALAWWMATRGSEKRDPPYGCFCARLPRSEAFWFCELAGLRSFFGFSAGLQPYSPRVAPPTEKHATGIDRRHARTAFVGGPPSGRSFSGTEPAPFAAGRRPPWRGGWPPRGSEKRDPPYGAIHEI